MSIRLSRRMFLGGAAAAGVLAAAKSSYVPPSLGVELYTVRNQMPKEDTATMRAIAKIGYRELEGDYPTLMRIAPLAKSLGLSMPSCHIPTGAVFGKYEKPLDQICTDLKGLGVEYAVVPYIAPPDRAIETLEHFGEKMNAAGAIAKKAGLQLAYHNHAFEWAQHDGKHLFHLMFGNTDPELVKFEVDVFWLSVGGIDPVHFLEAHAGRVPLLHLKDKAAAQKVQFSEDVTHETFKEIGSGNIDIPAVLAAAHKIGVKHYFVEQDWTPGDPLTSLKKSFDYVQSLRA